MANLSSLSVSALASALASVALGDVLAALAINARNGDSVDSDTFADSVNDLLSGAVDKANQTLAETKAIDVLVRREVSRMVLAALTVNAAKGDKASGAQRSEVHASLLKTLVTQHADPSTLNFKLLSDTIDDALDRCIASKQDDGTLTIPSAPYFSSKGKGGIKPVSLTASVLAAKYAAEYDAFVKENSDTDESTDASELTV